MNYKTRGTCSREISFDVVDNKVTNVRFLGGCSGNTQGVAALVEGMDVNEQLKEMVELIVQEEELHVGPSFAKALKLYLWEK